MVGTVMAFPNRPALEQAFPADRVDDVSSCAG